MVQYVGLIVAMLFVACGQTPSKMTTTLDDPTAFKNTLTDVLNRTVEPEFPNDLALAVEHYRNWRFLDILAMPPSDRPERVYLQARALGYTGRYKAAIALLKEHLRTRPRDPWLFCGLKHALFNLPERRAEFDELVRDILDSTDSGAMWESLRAHSLSDLGFAPGDTQPRDRDKLRAAGERMLRALALNPVPNPIDLDDYNFIVSILHWLDLNEQREFLTGEFVSRPALDAIPFDIEKFPDHHPQSNHPRLILSSVISAVESGKSATPELIRAAWAATTDSRVEKNPRIRHTILYKLAYLHLVRGEVDTAFLAYRKIQETSPDYAEIHAGLSYIHAQRNEWSAAADELFRLLEVNHRGWPRKKMETYQNLIDYLKKAGRSREIPNVKEMARMNGHAPADSP